MNIPSIDRPVQAALWRVYISGRLGFEKELGLVIAPAHDLRWAKSSSALAQDTIHKGSIEELLDKGRNRQARRER